MAWLFVLEVGTVLLRLVVTPFVAVGSHLTALPRADLGVRVPGAIDYTFPL